MTNEDAAFLKLLTMGVKEDFLRFLFMYLLLEIESKNEQISLLEMERDREDVDDGEPQINILTVQDKPRGLQ